MLHTVLTSVWINFKNLRFYILQYLMLVVIFPCSYLLISLTSSNAAQPIEVYAIGLFCSMQLSIFLNMQASMIANSNSITAIEQYATFRVRPLYVHLGSCVYHSLLSFPFLTVLILINLFSGVNINVILLLTAIILSLFMLSVVSMVLGGIFPNPNVATPIVNMIYMIIVMITPFYSETNRIPGTIKMLYCANPFAHIVSLLNGSFGRAMICRVGLSIVYIIVITFMGGIYCVKRWYRCSAAEKMNVL